MPTAFVTGATGFLGLNLVEQLSERGWIVVAYHRPTSNTRRLSQFPVRLIEGDIADFDAVANAVPQGVDAIFHLAANTSTWSRQRHEQARTNIEGTKAVIAAARAKAAKRLVHVSSWFVYGLEHATIHESTSQMGQFSRVHYVRTKALAEQEVKRAAAEDLPAVILNPAHILGRYDDRGWGRLFALVASRRLGGIPPGSGSFCHAEAVARAIIAAADRGRVGHNYLLGGCDATFAEVVRFIGVLSRQPVPRRTLSPFAVRLSARLKAIAAGVTGREPSLTPHAADLMLAHPRIVSTKARDELGYQPASLRLMLDDSYRWLKGEGYLAAAETARPAP
ncbi:MAG: NAD-dependent epimerase/dehydratase family protein, partial [Rhodospirillales bacterium]|nr:NAD-dependent epimerase/dehydratase family protein [Rhodospirillales bacterium]